MSKHRKHRAAPVDASHPTSLDQSQTQSQGTVAVKAVTRRVAWQLVAVLGASIVLGFAFNSSSPVGIRFSEPDSESSTIAILPAPPPPPPPVVAVTNRMVVLPPAPAPIEKPAEKPAPVSELKSTPFPTVALPSPSLPRVARPPSTTVPQAHAPAAPSPATPPAQLNPAPIHWAEAKPLVAAGQAVLVDVRHKAMYDAGHIPGAISLPETSSPEEFAAFMNQYPTNLALIVYCSSVSCSQSARVANRLVTQYQRPAVKYMTGGYMEYQQAEAAKPPTAP